MRIPLVLLEQKQVHGRSLRIVLESRSTQEDSVCIASLVDELVNAGSSLPFISDRGKPFARSLTCITHQLIKRKGTEHHFFVEGRSHPQYTNNRK